jgi:hypothetical protein
MSTEITNPERPQDPLIQFYNGMYSHFNQLARVKPQEAVMEMEDYIATLEHDPPIYWHTYLLLLLSNAYWDSGHYQKALSTARETSWVGSHLTPEAVQAVPESCRDRVRYIAKKASEVVGEMESSLEEMSVSEIEGENAGEVNAALSEDSSSSAWETDDDISVEEEAQKGQLPVEEEKGKGESIRGPVAQITTQNQGEMITGAMEKAGEEAIVKVDNAQAISELPVEEEVVPHQHIHHYQT